ncbi:MAG: GreA/GreB family elongation factor [Patescibacteria group bacterium]|jgi:transcription elongation factor GreA
MQVPKRKPGKYTHHQIDPYLTREKLQSYKDELERLKIKKQPYAISEVKRLAEMGDFSENAAYQIAKGRLRGINERIDQLEEAVKRAVIIDTNDSSGSVRIGHRVTVAIGGEQKIFQILGSAESDPQQGIISFTSPIGAALIGKRIGEIFTVKLGNKEQRCEVLKIE